MSYETRIRARRRKEKAALVLGTLFGLALLYLFARWAGIGG